MTRTTKSLAIAAFFLIAPAASARAPAARPAVRPQPLRPPDTSGAPAVRYGAMDRGSCEAELIRRKIPFARVGEARGVLAPVRLLGPLRGVSYRTELPAAERPRSPYEIFDCRLLLALDDFSAILASLEVVEVIHFSAYRPPSLRWPVARVGARHDGGLAIDAGKFVKKDGSVLHVEKDFAGRIGAPTCGPGAAPTTPTPAALELRKIVCDSVDQRLFNVTLTPDYDWPHRNHFHLEVTANVRWFILH